MTKPYLRRHDRAAMGRHRGHLARGIGPSRRFRGLPHGVKASLLGLVTFALVAMLSAVFPAVASAAGGASVSVTPATTTADSGIVTTYTLSYTCSVTGGCPSTTVTFPTTALTGDGPTTDFGVWLKKGTCPNLVVSGGTATITFGTIGTGTATCAFTIQPPEYTTFNNAQVTITPTISGTGFSATGTPATLTVTAGHHTTLEEGSSVTGIATGRSFFIGPAIVCGQHRGDPLTGDIGYTDITLTDTLPPNFTYTGWQNPLGSPPGATGTYDPLTRVFTYHDPTGETCNNPTYGFLSNGNGGGNVVQIQLQGTASTNGTPDTVGDTICDTSAQATVTYLDDGTTAAVNVPGTVTNCVNVVAAVNNDFSLKGTLSSGEYNGGQYPAPSPLPSDTPYTYPGNWDGTGNTARFQITLYENASTNGGVAFEVKDPMPCLDNQSGSTYSSLTPGAPYCQNPAFVPTLVTLTQGFTPTAADALTVVHADGSTTSVPWAPGGWVIPTSPTVAELDFPPFAEEGANTSVPLVMVIQGYAAASVPGSSVLTNTMQANAFNVGDTTPLTPVNVKSSSMLVANPITPSGLIVSPTIQAVSQGAGTCQEDVYLGNNFLYNTIEIASGSSQAIYIDYLAPVGATITTGANSGFTLQQRQAMNGFYQQATTIGAAINTGTITPSTQSNYGGTGRTLYEWVIPAGAVTQPGMYSITPNTGSNAWVVKLPNGCAGVQQNDLTVGYNGSVTACLPYTGANTSLPPAKPVPSLPSADQDLSSNGVPSGNFCGASFPLTVAAINPGFSVDKSVQGNLDATPVTGGGIGNVSPDGGTATYTLTFTNNGGSNLVDPVMYDLLPAVGDTNNTNLTARGSQFGVTLTGVGPAPAGVTVYYSQAANPCRPEVLANANNPGCVDDWTTTPPSPLSSVTALEFAYTGTVYVGSANGASSFSVPYTVSTPADIAGKTAWNTVGTTAHPGAGEPAMTPAESSRTGLHGEAGLTVVKTASPTTISAPGQTVTYTFAVTNDSAVTLNDITIDDTQTAPAGNLTSGPSCPQPSLAPSTSENCTATYTVTQADLDHGSINDSATVTGTPTSGSPLVSEPATATVTATQSPALTVTKSATPTTVTAAGDQVTYSFLVTNTGNVTATGVSVQDSSFSGTGTLTAITCPSPSLAPAAQETCTATYTVTAADLDAGSISNTATAAASAAGAPVTSPPSTATVTATQTAGLTLTKSASPTTVNAVGNQVSYSFLVTNTGNVTATAVAIHEGVFTGSGTLSAISCPSTALAAGDQETCTASYSVTQADLDAGSISNTATVTGTAAGSPVTTPPSTATVTAAQTAGLTLTKSASPTTVNAVGNQVGYSFLVTNTGNVTATAVAIHEGVFTGSGTLSAISCPSTTLAAGDQETCTASYSVTQADLDAGSISNTATVTGTAAGSPVTTPPSTATVTAAQTAGLTLTKSASPTTVNAVGNQVNYSFLVTNTGNVTATTVAIHEGTFTGSGALSAIGCPSSTLAPAAQETCTASYSVTQADLDAGSISNTATATGTAGGSPVTSAPSSATVTATQTAALTLVKSADPSGPDTYNAGQAITYSYMVTNTGNVTVTAVGITETSFTGSDPLTAPTCPNSSLSPGAQEVCTTHYILTQEDVDGGSIANTATATGTAAGGQVTSAPSTVTTPSTPAPALTLAKTANPTKIDTAGATVTFSFLITNSGNVTMHDIAVDETAFSGSGTLATPTCPQASLAPTEQETCSTSYSVTQADLDAGSISNTATAAGTDLAGAPIASDPSTATVSVAASPALTLVKSVSPTTVTAAGQRVTYSFAITNSGNQTVNAIAVTEQKFSGTGTLSAISCPATSLAPQGQETCTASYSITEADMNASTITNTAVVTGGAGVSAAAQTVASAGSTARLTVKRPAGPASGSGGASRLASTGADILGLGGIGFAALVLGGLVLLTGRRRRGQA